MAVSIRTITVDDADLHVEERGRGHPLLLLHGMTGVGADFRHLLDLDALAESHRVIVPDARGHGRSTGCSGDLTLAELARDVVAILDALEVPQACAIGLSLGALTLLHVATLAPDRVTAMVLVSAAHRFPEATRVLFREASLVARSPDEWTHMRGLHVHGDPQIERLWRLPARLAEDDIDHRFTVEQLGAITARTLLVTGDRDPFYPVEIAVELYRAIPRSSLWVIPDGLHLPVFLAERRAFAGRALEFLHG
jgi:pimeloyl-ACP methyl ester carboxylesterase